MISRQTIQPPLRKNRYLGEKLCAPIARQRARERGREGPTAALQVVQIEILRLLFLFLIGRCRGGRRRRQVLQVLLLSRLLLNEVGAVLAVMAVDATVAGIRENRMAVVVVAIQLLSGVLRWKGRHGVRHVFARAAALAVPGAAAAVGKIRFVRVECRRRRRRGRHLRKNDRERGTRLEDYP